jgi:hypothetical protein
LRISSVTTWLTSSTGIAKPTPAYAPDGDRIEELMPIRRPALSSSGPPAFVRPSTASYATPQPNGAASAIAACRSRCGCREERLTAGTADDASGAEPALELNVAADALGDGRRLRILVVLRPTERDLRGNIRLGDVITAIGDRPVKSSEDYFAALDQHKPGDQVTLAIERDGAPEKVTVTLGEEA